MPKIDLEAVQPTNATDYPSPFDEAVKGRWYRRLAAAAGITSFGASHVVLKPGAWSSQRHWHAGEDELLVMVSGDAVLIDDDGRTPLRPGDVAAFAAGDRNGHHLVNEGGEDCVFLVVSGGAKAGGEYSDIDMVFTSDDEYRHRDGTLYDAWSV